MKILNRLPFSEGRSEVVTPDGVAEVKPYQIIVTESLSARPVVEWDPGSPRSRWRAGFEVLKAASKLAFSCEVSDPDVPLSPPRP